MQNVEDKIILDDEQSCRICARTKNEIRIENGKHLLVFCDEHGPHIIRTCGNADCGCKHFSLEEKLRNEKLNAERRR